MNNEPVAWMSQGGDVSRSKDYFEEMGFKDLIPLYTHPHSEESVKVKELTDEEILSLTGFKDNPYDIFIEYEKEDLIEFARAILRKAQE